MNRGSVRFVAAFAAIIALCVNSAPAQPPAQPATPNVPNLLVEISKDFANAFAGQSMDQTDPVQDRRGRMQLTGSSHTKSAVSVQFVPSSHSGVVDLMLSGTADANTTARQGRVYLNVSTGFSFWGTKRVIIDGDGIRACTAQACPKLEYNVLNCIGTSFRGPLDPLVRRIAHRVYRKQQPKIERDATKSAGDTIRKKFDERVVEQLDAANRKYYEEIRRPMERRGVFPQRIRVMTSEHQFGIRALLLDPLGKTQTFTTVPDIHGWPDVAARIEQTLLNNASQAIFAGKRFTGEELDTELNALLKPVLKEEIQSIDPGETPFSITFPKEKPFEFVFDKGMIRATLRGDEYTSGDRIFDAMNTTAIYKLIKTEKGFVLERQGDLQIFPPGFVLGKDKLGARQQVLRKLLEKKFGRVFKPKFEVDELKLPEELKNGGTLVSTQVQSDNGWLVLAWRRVAPAPAGPPAVALVPSSR